ncbi:unnamed protein product [Dicrocoelium dendriticum]|nr:unnamed protein product [Dicrocoelium dendriticum]CAH8584666.1 unnamed protein product [Dicrocoelium dendriticum]
MFIRSTLGDENAGQITSIHSLVLWPLYPAAFTLLTEKLGGNCEPDAVDLDVDFTELLEQKFNFPNTSAPITALLYLSLSKHLLAPGSSASSIELKHWFTRAAPELTASIVVEVFSIVRLLGYPPHTLVNKSLDSLVHPSDSQALNRWLLGTGNEDADANEIVCRWRCANSSYTWLSITRLRDSTASTQKADASEQRYQPSTLSNTSSYRLTWLAGPQTLKGFYDPISVTHATCGLPTETLAGTCQNEENSGNNTHQKENAMDVDQQSNFNSNRCFPPTSVHPEIPMMNSQTHLRTSRGTTQQANEECMSLQFCFKDYPKLMPNNTKRNKPWDIR